MTKVSAILAEKNIKNIISVQPNTTVIDALATMKQYNIGVVVVIENDELVGIFSERDYARKGILEGRKAKSTTIAEIMTPKVFTVTENMTVRDCMEIMSEKKFRHLPVLNEDKKVIGVLSVGDIVTNLIKEQRLHINFLENYISS